MSGHVYSGGFYDYIDDGSRRSARKVASLLLEEIAIDSLLDVGAGHGAWAAEWLAAGVADIVAMDGDYVDRSRLAIPAEAFKPHNLELPFDLGRRFDLVQSLEVAEHLPAAAADGFVNSIVKHGDIVLFSAAVPNQGGEHHVNEQVPEYWRRKFAAHGYQAYDWLRPQLAAEKAVMPWYRFNSIVYANAAGATRLSDGVRKTLVSQETMLPIGGDLAWKLRRSAVGLVPAPLVKPIAMAKAYVETRFRGQAG